jgi:hypothetical protein
MEEEAAQIGGRRKLADVLNIALPAQEGSGSERTVLSAVIDAFDPDPETLVQFIERERSSGIEIGEKLLAHGAETAFDLIAAFGLIRSRVNNQNAERRGNARQLRGTVNLRVVDIKTNGYAACGDGLTETIERSIESLAGIEPGVRDEPAGVIEPGVEKDLHSSDARALHPGAEQHVGLPDLVAEFGFELLVRLRREELPLREAALFEEAIEGGGGKRGCGLPGRQSQFAQQRGAGAMGILAPEAFDEAQLLCDGAGLAPVLARFGGQRGEAAMAVARRVSSPRGRVSITRGAISA